MAGFDDQGRAYPTDTDPTDPGEWLRRYSLTDTGIVEVASRTTANTLLSQINTAAAAAGIPRRPVVVWRTDAHVLELHPNTGAVGEVWERVGGRHHQATVEFSRTLIQSPSTPLVLYAQSFPFASPGFTIAGNNLVIPASGRYSLSASVNLAGAAGTIGRTFYQFSTTNGALSARIPAIDEDNYAGQVTMYLGIGWQLRIQGYHEGGGDRAWTATMEIDWLGPRWGT